jgi:hypothetical protein
LRVGENGAAGVAEATVDTFVGSAGTWVQLQGTVGPVTEDCWLEFYVDCDGSAGQVNLDDYSASVLKTPRPIHGGSFGKNRPNLMKSGSML